MDARRRSSLFTMEGSRRKSLTLVAMSLAAASCAPLAAGAPEPQCISTPALELMRQLPHQAQIYCERRTAAQQSAAAELAKAKTVTTTVHAHPTIVMTVARDFVVTKTTTESDCQATATSDDGAAATTTAAVFHGGKRAVDAASDAVVTTAAPVHKRDSGFGRLLSHFAPFEIDAACTCAMFETTGEAVAVLVPNQKAETVTKTYTMMDLSPTQSTSYIDYTQTVWRTACV